MRPADAQDDNGDTLLHIVIRQGMKECLISRLNDRADLSLRNKDGCTALHEAVLQAENTVYGPEIEDEADTVKLIVNHIERSDLSTNTKDHTYTSGSVDVINIQDNKSNTALHLAAQAKHKNIVRVLVRHGAKMGLKNSQGRTAFHEAVETDEDEAGIVELMLDQVVRNIDRKNNTVADNICDSSRSVDVINIQDDKNNTALHLAVQRKHENVVRVLLNNGAEVELKNNRGRTALHEAVENYRDFGVIVQLLLNQVARLGDSKHNQIGDTLHHSRLVDFINVQDDQGNTALHLACKCNNKIVVRILLSYGANMALKNCHGRTALHEAVQNAVHCGGDADIVQLLVDQIVSLADIKNNSTVEDDTEPSSSVDVINIQDDQNNTPLLLAVRSKQDHIIRVLLSHGAEVRIKNSQGRTALHEAVQRYGDGTDLVELLVKQVARLAGSKKISIAEDTPQPLRLVDFINVQDDQGNTALHFASLCNKKVIVRVLLGYGAKVGLKNLNGRTALHEAVENCGGDAGMVQLLVDQIVSLVDIKNNSMVEDNTAPSSSVDVINIKDDQNNTPLILAVQSKQEHIVRVLLSHGAEVRIKNSQGRTALHEAVQHFGDDTGLVELLVNQVAILVDSKNIAISEDMPHPLRLVDFINIQDDQSNSALHLASKCNNKNIVGVLLGHGANVALKNSHGRTALHEAVQNYRDYGDIVQLLVNQIVRSADIQNNAITEDATDCLRSVDFVDIQDKQNNTALHLAVHRKHKYNVQVLIDHGADVRLENSHGRTALHEAVLSYMDGKIQTDEEDAWCIIVELLANQAARSASIKNKATAEDAIAYSRSLDVINIQNDDMNTALHLAVMRAHKNVARVLMNHGAVLGMKNSDGRTALHIGVHTDEVRAGMVELLLKQSARVIDVKNNAIAGNNSSRLIDVINIQDDEHYTALHLAVMRRNKTIVRLLMSNGAGVELKNDCGRTALHIAVDCYCVDANMVELLVNQNHSRSVNAVNIQDNECYTALHHAVQRGHENIVRILLNNGAKLEIKTVCGNTALHEAVQNYTNDTGILELLLNQVASLADSKNNAIAVESVDGINIQNREGETALHLATEKRELILVEMLVSHGADIGLKDRRGRTALHAATTNNNCNAVEFLLLKIAIDDMHCSSAAKYTTNSLSPVDIINTQDVNGCTALHYATEKCNNHIVKLLMDYRIDHSIKNHHGWNALRLAVNVAGSEMVDLLSNEVKKNNPDGSECVTSKEDIVNAQDDWGHTALHAVCLKPRYSSSCAIEILDTLIGKGAQLDVQNNQGQTLLHCALTSAKDELINLLLFAGARVDIPDNKGTTFIDACYTLSNSRCLMIPSCLFKFHEANMRPDITKKFDLSQIYTIHDRYSKILCEIEVIRTKRLEGVPVCLYTVLNPIRSHLGFVNNASLRCTIFGDTFQYQFPEYYHLIRIAFNEAEKIFHFSSDLSEKFSLTLNGILGLTIPEEVGRMILVELSSRDLLNLKSALEEDVRLEVGVASCSGPVGVASGSRPVEVASGSRPVGVASCSGPVGVASGSGPVEVASGSGPVEVASGGGQAQWPQPSPDQQPSPKRLKQDDSST